MGLEVIRDLWFCVDCTIAEVNGDWSGVEGEERVAQMDAGFKRLGEQYGHVSANFDSETEEGIREFSSCGCDCCGSRLAGTFHRFAVLGEKS